MFLFPEIPSISASNCKITKPSAQQSTEAQVLKSSERKTVELSGLFEQKCFGSVTTELVGEFNCNCSRIFPLFYGNRCREEHFLLLVMFPVHEEIRVVR